ncbi:MAG: peptide deformylase [Deltaproteobacteria bacterium]|nr:peptide deformylase [Deltaproteobacteria bacterium]
MAILPIRTFPDPVLTENCRPVETVDAALRDLADHMMETMYDAPGIGLAAPQVGETCRLVVVDVAGADEKRNPLYLFNPAIVEAKGEVVFEEACLSVPDYTADVVRASQVVLQALDREGRPFTLEAEGLLAICLQHELDHLDGRLFLDRISPLKRALYRKRRLKQLRRGEE